MQWWLIVLYLETFHILKPITAVKKPAPLTSTGYSSSLQMKILLLLCCQPLDPFLNGKVITSIRLLCLRLKIIRASHWKDSQTESLLIVTRIRKPAFAQVTAALLNFLNSFLFYFTGKLQSTVTASFFVLLVQVFLQCKSHYWESHVSSLVKGQVIYCILNYHLNLAILS